MELFLADLSYYKRFEKNLEAIAALNRINALSCIKSAEHGWIGSSFSIIEILTSLYFDLQQRNIILSKGHAAAAQYACLFGLGRVGREALLSYQDGPGALQAHADRSIHEILTNTGSLGQSLSKVAALAYSQRSERFTVILGDGELQEGQNFEALMTIHTRHLENLTVVVDVNGYQSKWKVDAVKPVYDVAGLFQSLGFKVKTVNGHDLCALHEAWKVSGEGPQVILATTVKGGGSALLLPEGETQPWHSRVPDDQTYLSLIQEQVQKIKDSLLESEYNAYAKKVGFCPPKNNLLGESLPSTRQAFSTHLTRLIKGRADLMVLDADLADSCGLSEMAHHQQFLEMGISEQDAVSFAGGLALSGKLPVVNTYAAFFKRAYEQMYVNASENSKIIYAGHYAGLCYFSDGRTHQSLSDVSMMCSIPGLIVFEPITPHQTVAFLDWALGEQPQSVYFRLRRTPEPIDVPKQDERVDRPLLVRESKRKLFVTMGTQATRLALDTMMLPQYSEWGLFVQCVLNGPMDEKFWQDHLRAVDTIVTIEEDLSPGSLHGFLHRQIGRFGLQPRVYGKCLYGFGSSFRSLKDCKDYFGFTVSTLTTELQRAKIIA